METSNSNNDAVKALQKQQFAKANRLFLELIHDHPKDLEYMRGLAITYLGMGKIEHAEKVAEKMLAVDPIAVQTYEILARIRLAQKKLEEAEALIRKAFEIAPNDPRILFIYGCVTKCEGQQDISFFYYERAYELDPDSVPLKYALCLQGVSLRKWDYVFSIILDNFKQSKNIRATIYLIYLYMFTSSSTAKLLLIGPFILYILLIVVFLIFAFPLPLLLIFPLVLFSLNFLFYLTLFLDAYLPAKGVSLLLTTLNLGMTILMLIMLR